MEELQKIAVNSLNGGKRLLDYEGS
jgi:hypothetical protein